MKNTIEEFKMISESFSKKLMSKMSLNDIAEMSNEEMLLLKDVCELYKSWVNSIIYLNDELENVKKELENLKEKG